MKALLPLLVLVGLLAGGCQSAPPAEGPATQEPLPGPGGGKDPRDPGANPGTPPANR